jgi:hypothetical protein
MSEKILFSIRRGADSDSTNLEGAFRVPIPLKELRSLGLKAGDPCQLRSEDGKKTGVGIAWQTPDSRDSGKRILKISDALKDAYGFSLEDKITIGNVESDLPLAAEIKVSFVTEAIKVENDYQEGQIRMKIARAMGNICQAPVLVYD